MRISEDIIMEIKYKNPIEEVISPYVTLKRAGRNLNGLCPFHNEKTPSFTVYPDTASFYCFGCGAGGDAFTFIKRIENLDYVEAVKKLAEQSGITIPEGDYDDSYLKLKNRIYEVNRETARYFNKYLFTPNGKWALDYLIQRGLSVDTINHFGLGCAPDGWDNLLKHLKSKGFSLNEMEQANVITKNSRGGYYDRFRNRTMFPIIEINGKVIGFSGRRHPDEDRGGKYINTSDTPVYKKSKSLFGFNFAKNCCSERLLIVEGNMDVVSLHQAGFENTIGTLGTAFTDEQARLLARYTKEVVLSFDSDAAGQKAASRAIATLSGSGLSVRVLSIPDGKDPDEFIKKNGRERFEGLLKGATNEIEYRLLRAAEGLNMETNDGKARYLNRVATELSLVKDAIAVDLYAGRVADKYGVSKEILIKKAEELRKKSFKAERKKEVREILRPSYKSGELVPEERTNLRGVKAEKEIISVLMAHPDLFSRLRTFTAEEFISALNKRVFISLKEVVEKYGRFDISFLGDEFSPEETGYIASLQNREVTFANPVQSLTESITTLREEKNNHDVSQGESTVSWEEQMRRIIEKKKESSK
ncbi:MAG: DNA primase [Clostridia bacterium]|nr:DNA primase [Clostridia bacterium]